MLGGNGQGRSDEALQNALALMSEALDILDANRAPARTGAYLETAMQEVRDAAKRQGLSADRKP